MTGQGESKSEAPPEAPMLVFDRGHGDFVRGRFDLSGHLLIEIGDGVGSEQTLFDAYGTQMYSGDRATFNPVFVETAYFGTSFDSFDECLALASKSLGRRISVIHQGLPRLERALLLQYLKIIRQRSAPLEELRSEHPGLYFLFSAEWKELF
ncbi:hypothetical protein [Deinococcus sp.]|uniref:hypothetical protein n=1 Tax=Deinococcus sp. TaxID=47478 RepID=UPI003CC55A79